MYKEIRHFKTKQEMDKAHQDDVSNFPMHYAFGNEQFETMMKEKFGMDTSKKSLSQITTIGAGCYLLKKDIPALKEMFAHHELERKTFRKDTKKLEEDIESEMWNHEYAYTGDPTDTLMALGFTYEDIKGNGRIAKAWKKMHKKVMAAYEEME